jgi:pimeloyl-ACP methyl ester carboxylesterase
VAITPDRFADLNPVRSPRVTVPGLHRPGLGLPMVGRVYPGGANAPGAGFQVPLTLVALPQGPKQTCCAAALVDPERLSVVPTRHGEMAVAMDLEAPIDATKATGPGRHQGLTTMLRPERFRGRPRIIFLQPFDPEKIPVVLVHGLMSTPRMWAPLVKSLLGDAQIRDRYQFWFFYYPTSQPIPLSALQLREALDEVVRTDHPQRPMILVGHSMGGILSRAQVSQITAAEADRISPGIAARPATNQVRRALIFEPRRDISRVVFMFTPHRGSHIAINRIGAWGKRLTRLPQWLVSEVAHYAHLLPDAQDGRLPTSIHGLSPHSRFLHLLDETRPTVPAHSIIGARRSGPVEHSSDGVVAYRSAHLDTAESELVVPAGHSGTAHPQAIGELRRILLQAIADDQPRPTVGN